MKKIGKWLLRVLATALGIILAVTLLPYAKTWVTALLGQLNYTQISQTLTHEMREVGKLTAVEYSDTGVMEATTEALFLGTVQRVSVPYQYDISLGIDLEKAVVEAGESSITVYLPDAELLSDKLTATDDPTIDDFWNLLTEKRYQAMLTSQEEKCRAAYTDDAATMEGAWNSAQKALQKLMNTWLDGLKININFEHLSAYNSDTTANE